MFWHWRSLAFRVLKCIITRKFPSVKWISTRELAQWLEDAAKPQPIVLDVRSEAEYAVSHLKSAMRIDPCHPNLDELSTLKVNPQATHIVVYCSVGYRSASVAQQLEQAGFYRIYNLEGSIFQWANEERPVYKNNQLTLLVHPYNARWGKLLKSRHRAK